MTRRVLFALASASLLIGCVALAPDPEPSACFAPEWRAEAYRDAVLATTEGTRYDELTEAERLSFLRAYNNSRPPTGVLYERIGFFEHPHASSVMVAFIEKGCVWTTGVLPRALFFAMASRAMRAPSTDGAPSGALRSGV